MEYVVLVDSNDVETGRMEKMEAHLKGLLHRAFSVLIYNSKGELLLQKRAADKYHSGGLWTNTCCSHPHPGEDIIAAAARRLKEEMGIVSVDLKTEISFIYRAELENGLVEHEFDHIVKGRSESDPILNPKEADSFRWISPETLEMEVKQHPELFTFWFKEMIKRNIL